MPPGSNGEQAGGNSSSHERGDGQVRRQPGEREAMEVGDHWQRHAELDGEGNDARFAHPSRQPAGESHGAGTERKRQPRGAGNGFGPKTQFDA